MTPERPQAVGDAQERHNTDAETTDSHKAHTCAEGRQHGPQREPLGVIDPLGVLFD